MSLFLFTFYRISSSSPFCTNFSILCSHLYFGLYENVPKFSNSNVLVLLINFLYTISSLICSHFLLKNCSLNYFVPLHFRSICDSFPSSSYIGHFPLYAPFLRTLSFQIPSPNHAIAFLSLNLQKEVLYNSLPHSFFISQYALIDLFSLILSFLVSILLQLLTSSCHITLISQSFPFCKIYNCPVLYNSSLKLAADLFHFRYPICQS